MASIVKRKNKFSVGNIALYEFEQGVFERFLQGFQIACIRQLVQANQGIIRMRFLHIIDKVAADKAGTAGD